MFYDEIKSPYQYKYWSVILEFKNEEDFNLQKEITYISTHRIFQKEDYIVENYINLYQHKDDILSLIFSILPKEIIKNISIWWSFILKKYNKLSDLDINIIVEWNYFSYIEIPNNLLLLKTWKKISNKISLLIFWEENFNKETQLDSIITPNYFHRNLAMREWIIWNQRNLNIYWKRYITNTDSEDFLYNLKTRLLRQCKFAELIFDWLFDHYNTEDRISNKMSSRIWEAWIYMSLEWYKIEEYNYYFKLYTWEIILNPYELLQESKNLTNILTYNI